jgi:hypothetical protein
VIKLFIGILKGSILGGLIGYGAYALAIEGALQWGLYGLIGAIVGLVVGRPIWSLIADKNATSFAAILKAIVGFAVGIGIFALVRKFGSNVQIELLGETRAIAGWQPMVGAAIGGLWGGFVELDDGVGDPPASSKPKKQLDKPK